MKYRQHPSGKKLRKIGPESIQSGPMENHPIFSLGSENRQRKILHRVARLSSEETTIFYKIVALAKNGENSPVHIITAMSKASELSGLAWFCHYVIQCKLNYGLAKFWGHKGRMREAMVCLNDFKIACDAWTQHITLEAAARERRMTVVKNKQTLYQGKKVPFKFGSTLRNKVMKFKANLTNH